MPPSYFDERYAQDPDPWRFATSAYERAKYAAALNALPRQHYASALEVGCSIGVLTEALAGRCDRLHGLDLTELALALARARCRDRAHVGFELAQVPSQWPEGSFDLILMSEVVYYLDAGDVERLVERVRNCLQPGSDVVLAHWTGQTHYPLTGEEAAERFIEGARSFLHPRHQARADAYRLDVLGRGRAIDLPDAEDRLRSTAPGAVAATALLGGWLCRVLPLCYRDRSSSIRLGRAARRGCRA